MTSDFALSISKPLLFCLFFIFCHGTVSAQIVTTVSGYPVIDLSNLISLGCILSSSEAYSRRTDMNAQAPSNGELLSVGIGVSGEAGIWNSKMSTKYQLMCADHTAGATNWANAYTQCKQYSGEGGSSGQWRLPTQRELLMIIALHPQLQGISGFTSFTARNYWSSTEGAAPHAWYINFDIGTVYYGNYKTMDYSVRCVRDL